MEDRQTIIIRDWEGLNTRLSDLQLRPGQSPSLNNIEFFKEGWKVRGGLTTFATLAAAAVTSIFHGFNHLLATATTNVYRISSGGTETLINSGLTAGTVPVWASYNGLDMMVTGSGGDAPRSWDGTTWQNLAGSPPNADDIEVWRNHVWLTGLASPNQGEVRFSAQEDPEVWPSGNFLRPTKRERGGTLICSRVCPFPGEEDGTRLVVFGADRIYHFDGFTKSLFQIYAVRKGIGSVSKRGHVNAEDFHYWVDENGIYCTPDGGYTVNPISWNIQPTFDALNKSRLHLCCAVHHRNKKQIWWSFSNGVSGTHNIIFVYNYGLSTPMVHPRDEGSRHVWSLYDYEFMSMAEYLTSDNEYMTFGGQSTAGGKVWEADDSAPGADTVWSIKTGRILLSGSWSRQATLRKVNLVHDRAVDEDITLRVFTDVERTTPIEEATIALDTTSESIQVTSANFNRVMKAVQFSVKQDSTDLTPRIYELGIEYTPLRGTK